MSPPKILNVSVNTPHLASFLSSLFSYANTGVLRYITTLEPSQKQVLRFLRTTAFNVPWLVL